MVASKDLVTRITELVEAMTRSSQPVLQDLVLESEVTFQQIRILYQLASGPARITDIAHAQEVALPNASNTVQRLVTKGFVERVSDPNDRRVALARLTVKGRETVEGFTRSKRRYFEEIATVLSNRELEDVTNAFEILDSGIKRLEAQKEDDGSADAVGSDQQE